MTLQTPIYDMKNFPEVYSPSEDTFLMLDALEKDMSYIKSKSPTFALEIGSGSGVTITAVAKELKTKCACFAVDINGEACVATAATSEKNNAGVQICNSDLFSCFKRGLFDLVIFNPPYVVTEEEELSGNGVNRAWAGGNLGRRVIDRFLLDLPRVLSPSGLCYLLLLKENDPKEVSVAVETAGFDSKLVIERKIPGEHLFVVRFSRKCR